jgi:hypothetical protein
VVLKDVRLAGVAQFQLWASSLSAVDTAITDLQVRLLDARDALRAAGFLRVAVEGTSVPETITALNACRKTLDLAVLYDQPYEDDDGASSLITQIPITVDAGFDESMLVTDEMARWDMQSAPTLRVDGLSKPGQHVTTLSVLAFLPVGWNGQAVTIDASIDGVAHQQIFPTVRAFLGACTLEPQTVELDGKQYSAGILSFPNAHFPQPLVLRGANDSVQISYAAAAFDQDAIVYLRALT